MGKMKMLSVHEAETAQAVEETMRLVEGVTKKDLLDIHECAINRAMMCREVDLEIGSIIGIACMQIIKQCAKADRMPGHASYDHYSLQDLFEDSLTTAYMDHKRKLEE